MNQLRVEGSLRSRARRAGLLYLLSGITVPFGLIYVPSALLVPGDAAATAARIGGSPGLVRMGIASELLACVLLIIAVLAFYRLFRQVSSSLAALMAVFILLSVPIQLANVGNYAAALLLTGKATWLGAFNREQLDALTYVSIRLHASGHHVVAVFWGLWLFPLGLLMMRSGFIPRWIGGALLVAGFGYVLSSATALFFPSYLSAVRPGAMLMMAGEVPMIVWLVGWGARPNQLA